MTPSYSIALLLWLNEFFWCTNVFYWQTGLQLSSSDAVALCDVYWYVISATVFICSLVVLISKQVLSDSQVRVWIKTSFSGDLRLVWRWHNKLRPPLAKSIDFRGLSLSVWLYANETCSSPFHQIGDSIIHRKQLILPVSIPPLPV